MQNSRRNSRITLSFVGFFQEPSPSLVKFVPLACRTGEICQGDRSTGEWPAPFFINSDISCNL